MSTYIFDFDGTLGDSMPYFTKEMLAVLERRNISYPEDTLNIVTPLGYSGTAKYYVEKYLLLQSPEELVAEMHENLYPVYRDTIVLKPGVTDYLNKLKKQGHSLQVLTASPFRMVAPVLQREGVFELFDHVWSCEDFGRTKSDPEIYREAVERAGGKIEDTLFFDDNLEAIRTAVKAGIYTVGVYDETSVAYVEQIKEIADRFVYNLV